MTLKEYKESKGLTLHELAAFLEMKPGTVYNVLRGREITLRNAHKILEKTHGVVGYADLLRELPCKYDVV